MEKRFILFIFLTVAILVIYQFLTFTPPKDKSVPEEEEKITEVEERLAEEGSMPESISYEPGEQKGRGYETPLYSVFISEEGGISRYQLRQYTQRKAAITNTKQDLNIVMQMFKNGKLDKESFDYKTKKLRYNLSRLENSKGEEGVDLISFSELSRGLLLPHLELEDKDNKKIWQEQGRYEIEEKGDYDEKIFRLTQTIPSGLKITKTYSFKPSSYLADLKVELHNLGNQPQGEGALLLTIGPEVTIPEEMRVYTFQGPTLLINNELKQEKFKKGQAVERSERGQVKWAALQDKYFAKVLIPQDHVEEAWVKNNRFEEALIGLKQRVPPLAPGQKEEFSFQLYLGPKKLEPLQEIGKELPRLVDYGLFGNLFRIIYVLKFFHRITHNYGVAIILLTILMNIVLFPLSRKSFKSMKEMRLLQPEMEKIRKQYRDDPQAMNKEVMELYRRHRVNPMGGCLPMLFQMPIFIGLFMTLRSAIELRGAHFFWWIKDLSLPDTLYELSFSLPLVGSSINILPLIMGGATYLQQRFSSAGQVGGGKMMLFMPVFLIFIFYNFPSGLVLYFLCNNILSIIQQSWISRKR